MEVNYRFMLLKEATAEDTLEGPAADDVEVNAIGFAAYDGREGCFTIDL